MTTNTQVIDLLLKRLDVQDRIISSQDQMIVSINDNLAGIREVLGKLELHDHRLNEQRQEIYEQSQRVKRLEDSENQNKTVMAILNKILILGIPSMIGAIVFVVCLLWYGINNPVEPSYKELDAILSKYIKPAPP